MPIDCGASFIDVSEVCTTGKLIVNLRDSATGNGFFSPFDSFGGPANGISGVTATGFQSANNPPPYNTDFSIPNNPNYQTYAIDYNLGTQTSDSFVIQETSNGVPVGDACQLFFNPPTAASCNTGGQTYSCTTPNLDKPDDQDLCITYADLGVPDGCVIDVLGVFNSDSSIVIGHTVGGGCVARVLASSLTVGLQVRLNYSVRCNNVTQATGCNAYFNIVDGGGNTGNGCIECNEVQSNVQSNDINSGETLVIFTTYAGNLNTNTNLQIVDDTNAVVGFPTYISTINGENRWEWTAPTGACGTHGVQMVSDIQDATCQPCFLFNFNINCDNTGGCTLTPIIDQCNNGQIMLTQGVPLNISVIGCDCADSVLWSSPDSEITFGSPNSTSTSVTSTATGSFTINVDCCLN